MIPTLLPGQRVVVEFTDADPGRGELILFRQADYQVVHRVLGPAVSQDGRACLRTRGDHLPGLDPVVDRARVLGRVVSVEEAEGSWWDLRGGAAPAYGLAVALHDLFWAVAAVAAARADAGLVRVGLGELLRRQVVGWDRRLLRLAHRVFFPLCHRRTTVPPASNEPC